VSKGTFGFKFTVANDTLKPTDKINVKYTRDLSLLKVPLKDLNVTLKRILILFDDQKEMIKFYDVMYDLGTPLQVSG